jgi:hypothetical protein
MPLSYQKSNKISPINNLCKIKGIKNNVQKTGQGPISSKRSKNSEKTPYKEGLFITLP